MLAVEHDPVGLESLRRELRERARSPRGAAPRSSRGDRIPRGWRGRPRCHAPTPRTRAADTSRSCRRQQLRIAHAGKVLFTGHDRGDRHRTGPRAPADLVDPDDDPVARRPALPLDAQRRDTGAVTPRDATAGQPACLRCGSALATWTAGHAPYHEVRETRHPCRGPGPFRVELDARIRGRRPRRRDPTDAATRPMYKVRRRSDGSILPVLFDEDDLREERRRSTWWI